MRFGPRKVTLPTIALVLCCGCVVSVAEGPGPVATPPVPPPMPASAVDPDVGMFYDDLSPYGAWLQLDAYGWVWTPWNVGSGWRPYSLGHWIATDDGWLWQSDEAWGWGPYHYGRWLFDSYYGWVWVPGREWAPAWVAWRYGGGWIGWAPLPPGAVWRVGVGLDLGGVDLDVAIAPHCWGFVAERAFLDPHVGSRFEAAPRNVTIVNVTRNVTHYVSVQNRVVVRSIETPEIERATHRAIERHRIEDLDSRSPDRRDRVEGSVVRVFRPTLGEAPPGRAPRAAVRQEAPAPVQQPGRVPPAGTAQTGRPTAPPPPPGQARGRETRAPAGPPAAPDPALLKRQEDQRRELDRRLANERSQLDRIHKQEAAKPPAGMRPDQVRQAHDAEARALDEQAKREKQVLENRQALERKERPAPPSAAQKSRPPKGKKVEDNKGQGK